MNTFRLKALNQYHPSLTALAAHLGGPDACLCLADMRFVQEYHTKSALTDAATNGQGKRVVQ